MFATEGKDGFYRVLNMLNYQKKYLIMLCIEGERFPRWKEHKSVEGKINLLKYCFFRRKNDVKERKADGTVLCK